jgi:dephospho-CoA kinase
MKVVCIVGLPGSGKSEALKTIEKMGIPTFNMGDIVTKIEPARRGIRKVTHDIENEIRQGIRKEHGPAALAVMTAQELEKRGSDFIVIGGLHTFAEMDYFRDRFRGDFHLVAIKASFETRARRSAFRRNRPMSRGDLEKREMRYREQFDVQELVEQAEFTINNEGSREKLSASVRELVERLRK